MRAADEAESFAYCNKYNELPEADRFEAIVWRSAKQPHLTADGILTQRQHFNSKICQTQSQRAATIYGLLKSSYTHTFPGAFPQPFDITHGWLAEELFVLAIEVCGIVISHTIAGIRRVQALAEHEPTGFLEP